MARPSHDRYGKYLKDNLTVTELIKYKVLIYYQLLNLTKKSYQLLNNCLIGSKEFFKYLTITDLSPDNGSKLSKNLSTWVIFGQKWVKMSQYW